MRTSTPAVVITLVLGVAVWAGAQAPAPPQTPPPPQTTPPPQTAPAPQTAPQASPQVPPAPNGEAPRPATNGQTITAETLLQPKGLPAVIIDPGHGGEDAGAKSDGGIQEKQLTLDIARRVRAILEARGTMRTLLTREGDVAVSLDARAGFANSNGGVLFLSIHGNVAPSSTVEGAEVYYQPAERPEPVRAGGAAGPSTLSVFNGGTRTLELVPWDRAQLAHVPASAAFAELIAQQMAGRVPVGASPVRRAPMRLLQALNMPAVLVEVAFLSSPVQEKQIVTDDFKNQMAQSLSDAIAQFQRPPDPRGR